MVEKYKKYYSESEINLLITKYKASNLSISEFIKKENLSRSMFYRWIKKREEVTEVWE